jgi:hypothetical protein
MDRQGLWIPALASLGRNDKEAERRLFEKMNPKPMSGGEKQKPGDTAGLCIYDSAAGYFAGVIWAR